MDAESRKEDEVFEELLDYLKQARGFDFTGYKRSSLKRRAAKQMHSHNISSFELYLDYLQVRPEEFIPLFNTILINVTAFFRDPQAWHYLQDRALPAALAHKADRDPIRIWSAGCSSGEEAYSLAIILTELLGVERFRRRVKIYATDVDEEALAQARHASYSLKQVQSLPPELREKYFEASGNQFIFRSDLRRAVIFGRHDLVQDAPISRLDLLVCRNTLMYFNAETQTRILDRFHFALNDTGLLFLGKAEMLLTHINLFTPINLQYRIFSRIALENRRDRWLLLPTADAEENSNQVERHRLLRELAFDAVPLAQIVVDVEGKAIFANTHARNLFNINLLDLGRPLQDLEISYRPVELRSPIEQVYREGKSVAIRNVSRLLPDESQQYFDILLEPLRENSGELLGASITFSDVTRYHDLQTQLERTNQELETANEELQSSNEELETTNEELQSTNEELETMNEELQSTNEELQTINDELRQRTGELNQANAFLNSILTSLRAGVVVVDPQFDILSWNDEAENLWGLRAEEVRGKSLLGLDIGLPVERLREPIRKCLSGVEVRQEMVLAAVNRRGRAIHCRITYNPLIGPYRECQGAILSIEEIEPPESDCSLPTE